MNRDNYRKALERAMSLCSRSEKCASDIMNKLRSWGMTTVDENNALLKELVENDFINEKRYAEAYTRDKVKFNKWGRYKIRNMLRAKGLSEEDVEHGIRTIDEEGYREMIEEELRNKKRSLSYKNIIELKAKLVRFASSRGYEKGYVFEILEGLNA